MQNPTLQKDLSFISNFESNYFTILAKDLIKLVELQDVFTFQTNKNLYQIREKFAVQLVNGLDVHLNLSQGFCTVLNMSAELIERPYILYYMKTIHNDDPGVWQIIDKYEVVNVNPYTIVLEDKSLLNIYSMIDPGKHYRYKIEECKFYYF